MSIRSERIKALIERSEKSYIELEKSTGVKKSSLQRYASGATSKIPLDVIEKLAKEFNVSQAYLMGWDEETKTKPPSHEMDLSEGELALVELFREVPEEQQQLVLSLIRAALNNQAKQ